MDDWFFQHNGEPSGPLAFAVLCKFAAKGVIIPSTLVRNGTDGPWVEARAIDALISPQSHNQPEPTSSTASTATAEANLGDVYRLSLPQQSVRNPAPSAATVPNPPAKSLSHVNLPRRDWLARYVARFLVLIVGLPILTVGSMALDGLMNGTTPPSEKEVASGYWRRKLTLESENYNSTLPAGRAAATENLRAYFTQKYLLRDLLLLTVMVALFAACKMPGDREPELQRSDDSSAKRKTSKTSPSAFQSPVAWLGMAVKGFGVIAIAVSIIVLVPPRLSSWMSEVQTNNSPEGKAQAARDRYKQGATNYTSDFSQFRQLLRNIDVEYVKKEHGDFVGTLTTYWLRAGTEVTWSATLTKVEPTTDGIILSFSDYESPAFESTGDIVAHVRALKVFVTVTAKHETEDLWSKHELPSTVAFKGNVSWLAINLDPQYESNLYLRVKDAVPVLPGASQK